MGNLMPGLQGSYDAAMRDPIRQFNEQTIPGINMGASGAGQAFGTRGANQTAIAARGLQDRAADTASQLWANAANQANAGAMAGGQMNLGSANKMVDTLTQGFQNYANMGLNANNQGYNMMSQNLGNKIDAGNMVQGINQAKVDEDVNRYNFNMQAPYDRLGQNLDMYNMFKLGGTPGRTGPSTLQNILNGAQAGAGRQWVVHRQDLVPRFQPRHIRRASPLDLRHHQRAELEEQAMGGIDMGGLDLGGLLGGS